jgi:phosphatidylglycerophosphate synthase
MAETPYQPKDRRPIAARRWPIWQRVSVWLAHRGASPNGISLAGMGCGIAAGLVLALTSYTPGWERLCWLTAAMMIQLRLLANLLDGMVAIESGRASLVGELYNEVPDRISDTATLIGAGYAAGGDIVLGDLAACVALFTAYVRALGKGVGAPAEFCGPMAKQQRMFTVTMLAVYCGLAPNAWQPTDASGRGAMATGLALIVVLGLVTGVRRLRRIASNLRKTP